MEIVKAFSTNNLHTNIVIRGTYEDPIFRAIDIAEILQINNIRKTIKDYTEGVDKVTIDCQSNSGIQKTNFLTEFGLYKIIFLSKSEFGNTFRLWVCQVIKELRMKGVYDMNKKLIEEKEKTEKLEQEKLQIEEMNKTLQNEKTQIEEEHKNLLDETNKILRNEKIPYIYIYNLDTRQEIPELKIGYTTNVFNRIRPYKQTHKFGKIEFSTEIQNMDVKTTEHFIHILLSKYKIADEVFKLSVPKAQLIILKLVNLITVVNLTDEIEKEQMMKKMTDYEYKIINNDEPNKISTRTIETQTEIGTEQSDENIMVQILESVTEKKNEMEQGFDNYIRDNCIVRPDVEVSSTDIIGQYRIMNKSATEEFYQALNEYLKRKFKPSRLRLQNKNQVTNGFEGVKLKDIEYIKKPVGSDPQTFIFNACVFSPSGKTLINNLVDEYARWKRSLDKEYEDKTLLKKELRTYLKECDYVLYTTIWSNGNGQGYYGLSLKNDVDNHRMTSSTGKRVEKRNVKTNDILQIWETIAKAATAENMCAANMSRIIKHRKVFNDDYYYCTTLNI